MLPFGKVVALGVTFNVYVSFRMSMYPGYDNVRGLTEIKHGAQGVEKQEGIEDSDSTDGVSSITLRRKRSLTCAIFSYCRWIGLV